MSVSQSFLDNSIATLTSTFPGCVYTADKMSLQWVYAVADPLANIPILSLDAVAFGLGQNNVPK